MNSTTITRDASRPAVPSAGLPAPPAEQPVLVQWRVWPARDEWRTHWPLLAVAVALFVATSVLLGSVAIAGVVFLLIAATLWRAWLPIDYELSAKGLTQTVLGRTFLTPWKDIRRYELREGGLFLLPTQRNTALDALRGFFLPCGPRRIEVAAIFVAYLGPATNAAHQTEEEQAAQANPSNALDLTGEKTVIVVPASTDNRSENAS